MKKNGFTLVELLLVVTLLVILGTIAIISFKGYSASARDSVKITNLQRLDTALSLYYQGKESLPIPKDAKTVNLGTGVLTYEGEFSDNIMSNIGYSGTYIDTLNNESYLYSISSDKKNHSILTYLEGEGDIVTQASASSRDNVFVSGRDVGVILNSDNSPITSDFDYNTATGNYNIIMDGVAYSGDKDFIKFSYAQLKNNISLEKDLVLYYDFETVTEDGKLKDLSGKGMHGSKYQGTSKYKFGNDVGVKGKSTYFDAKNLVSTPNSGIEYQYDDSLTVSYWLKFTNSVYGHPMGLLRGDSAGGYTYRYYDVEKRLSLKIGNQQSPVGNFEINKRYNVAFVAGTTNTNVYINGKKVLSRAFPKVNTTSPITFGEVFRGNVVTASLFEGNIDEAKIYNRSLSDDEIMLMYNQNKVD